MENKWFRCTFTGVDEFTSLAKIKELSIKYPFVEWGVLLSTSENRSRNGHRYPSLDWLNENLPKLQSIAKESKASIALHVCGKETKLLLENKEDSQALNFLPYVNRIQINFVCKNKQEQELENLCENFPNTKFITQHNEANKDLHKKIKSVNHQILFDASGGRGIKTEVWPQPFNDKVCGYAGGLGLENIEQDFENIKNLAFSHFWIDMEGRIRTEDKLDLDICEKILEKVSTLS
jgi:phosphoribosylanthranilate isomerase